MVSRIEPQRAPDTPSLSEAEAAAKAKAAPRSAAPPPAAPAPPPTQSSPVTSPSPAPIAAPVAPPVAPPATDGVHDGAPVAEIALPEGVDLATIQKAGIFKGLTPERVNEFLAIGKHKLFKAGDELVHEGGTDTELYLLLRGKVDIRRLLTIPLIKGGSEQMKSIVQLTSPMMGIIPIGAPNMLAGGGRTATVVALEDSDTLMITREAFDELCERDTRLGYVMARNIATSIVGDLGRTNQQVLKLTTALTLALQKRS